jgi:hypothetical protein
MIIFFEFFETRFYEKFRKNNFSNFEKKCKKFRKNFVKGQWPMSSERDTFAKGIFSTFAKGFLLHKLLLNYLFLMILHQNHFKTDDLDLIQKMWFCNK